jgi:Cu/Zn superoxide dismutase
MHTPHLSTMDVVHILQRQKVHALANLKGSDTFPAVSGSVSFYDTSGGTLVTVSVTGLPEPPVFSLHLEDKDNCSATAQSNLPPLTNSHGNGWYTAVTDQFRTCDIVGKTILLQEESSPAHQSIAWGVVGRSESF